jgi:predicted nucleic acid-binding protein
MSRDAFFDSNVLLYLVSADSAKADRAEALLGKGGIASVQVLNEICSVCVRRHGMSWEETDRLLDAVRAHCRIEPLTEDTFDLGRRLAERYRLSVYDAMIVAAAMLAGSKILHSEDLHDGLLVEERLVVRNPFRARSVQDRAKGK